MEKDKISAKNSKIYIDTLDHVSRARYLDKLKLINGEDPYQIHKSLWKSDVDLLPDISYPDIVNYCVYTRSAYTLEDLKGYKSLEAYNQFVCGWVSDITTRQINDKRLVASKVRHSQSISKAPLQPWIIAETTGTILAAHCTCMAGLGEVCSHVAATLFAVDSAVKLRNSKTVTQEKAYWLLPSGIKKIQFKEVRDINFKSAKSMKKQLDTNLGCLPAPETKCDQRKLPYVSPPSESELTALFTSLMNSGTKPSVLSVMPGYSSKYIPAALGPDKPKLLSELRDDNCVDVNYEELLEVCESVFKELTVSKAQSELVAKITREQASSKEWFRFRSGRITASRMKSVCATSVTNPAKSLIKAICYPETSKFQTKATKWGCDHEQEALQEYKKVMMADHDGFTMDKSGFIISVDHPFIGASPDSLVECNCCGKGTVEVKCPFCMRDKTIQEGVAEFERTCLEQTGGNIALKKNHPYFYQVQTQMLVTNTDFADFVVWTKKGLHHERLELDSDIVEEICAKSAAFFKQVLLPELVGRFYSRPQPRQMLYNSPSKMVQATQDDKHSSDNDINTVEGQDLELICICQTPYNPNEKYAECNNENCPYKKCHMMCMAIKRKPRGTWYCITCRKLPEFKTKRRVKKSSN